MTDRETLLKILDLARWAPSGDNTQPWRFEIVGDDHIAIHGHDTRDWCVYDFDGHASHMAHGALLETLRIAATAYELESHWQLRSGSLDAAPVYEVTLTKVPGMPSDSLVSFIESRTVQRRPMRVVALENSQRKALKAAAGAGYSLDFLEPLKARWSVAKVLWSSAHIRLTSPEAYEVHREVIEWGARYSVDRIPEQAVGVDPLTAKLMAWVMQSWARVEFFNRYLFGTVVPRIQLDLIPALACSAHLVMRPAIAPTSVADYVTLGMAMQRVWLTATSVGLHLQPEMTPVIFRWYARMGRAFSAKPAICSGAISLADSFESLVGAGRADPIGFFCRIGKSSSPKSRSVRKRVSDLMV